MKYDDLEVCVRVVWVVCILEMLFVLRREFVLDGFVDLVKLVCDELIEFILCLGIDV